MIDKVQLARGARNSDKQERATENLPRESRKETPILWQIFAYLAIGELFSNSNVSSSMSLEDSVYVSYASIRYRFHDSNYSKLRSNKLPQSS